MGKRFVSIWFPFLLTDACRRHTGEASLPLAIVMPEKGRMKIKGVNAEARQQGIDTGMVAADARAVLPRLKVADYRPGTEKEVLTELALWCLQYTPIAALDEPDGLLLDASGCSHLWGSEQDYLEDMGCRLRAEGFDARMAMADTIGMAWAAARYYENYTVIEPGMQAQALECLPPAALRLEAAVTDKLAKLGLYRVGDFAGLPRDSLRRRFGAALLTRLDGATGAAKEYLQPVTPPVLYRETLPCPEPVTTATGISIALKQLLTALCRKLLDDRKGLRTAVFKGIRVDGNLQQIAIGTHKPSRNMQHLFRLFELKIATIAPGLGIELFLLEAPLAEPLQVEQERFWTGAGQQSSVLTELLDRIAGKIGAAAINRYLPEARYWPEQAIRKAQSAGEQPAMEWPVHRPRPVHVLPQPEPITVTVPLPDYPPLLFIYQGRKHKIRKADGPERIEPEWWIEKGLHRDYYQVEDEDGCRYWLFRLGHYNETEPKWFLHGFFA